MTSEDNFSHDQVFGITQQASLSAEEAAEYLGISALTLREYVRSGRLIPSRVVGHKKMFSAQSLRAFKRIRKA